MLKSKLVIAMMTLTLSVTNAVSAQVANRKGFYIDGLLNYSAPSDELTGPGGSLKDTQGSFGYGLGIGGGVSNQLRIGGQVDTFITSNAFQNDVGPGLDATTSFVTLALTFYPSLTNDFWIRANLGYGVESLSGDGESASGGGFAGGLGVGYDILLGKSRKFALVPYISYLDLFKSGDMDGAFAGEGIQAKVSVFQIGIGIGYRH
jgi:hypothetical protein